MNSTIAPTEMQLSLAAVAHRVAEVVGQPGVTPTFGELNEASVLRFAQWHNMLPWVSLYADRYELGSQEFRKKLAKLSSLDRAVDRVQMCEVTRLSRVLNENQVSHIFFKGVTITELFYRGLVNSRYSDDIDLLIKSDDFPRVYHLMSNNGYQQSTDIKVPCDVSKLTRFVQRYPSLYRWRDISLTKDLPPKQQLDLHWQIADLFTFPVDAEQLIEQQKPVCVQGESLAALPFAMLFVYVCVHGHTDYFFRLRYLVDVYAAMYQSEFNKVEVLEIAKNLGVEQKVIDSIATAKLFFDGEQTRNEYAVFVLKRFVDSNGYPVRSHPNHKQWTRLDRRQYLLKQIEYRSANSRWYEPIVARCKYNESMIDSWPEHIPPWIWYPVALVKRLLKEPLIKSK